MFLRFVAGRLFAVDGHNEKLEILTQIFYDRDVEKNNHPFKSRACANVSSRNGVLGESTTVTFLTGNGRPVVVGSKTRKSARHMQAGEEENKWFEPLSFEMKFSFLISSSFRMYDYNSHYFKPKYYLRLANFIYIELIMNIIIFCVHTIYLFALLSTDNTYTWCLPSWR